MRNIEIFLVELIFFLGLWLWDAYVALLLTLIMGTILCLILVVALISEKIEKSKVPKRYFQLMAYSIGAILLAALIYYGLYGDVYSFMMFICL